MNRNALGKFFDNMVAEARNLLIVKSKDYSSDTDAFHNFNMARLLQIDPELGIMLRMLDKQARILNFIKKGRLELTTESWQDACVDLVNYTVLLCAMLTEKTELSKTKPLPGIEINSGKKRGRPRK